MVRSSQRKQNVYGVDMDYYIICWSISEKECFIPKRYFFCCTSFHAILYFVVLHLLLKMLSELLKSVM